MEMGVRWVRRGGLGWGKRGGERKGGFVWSEVRGGEARWMCLGRDYELDFVDGGS